MSCFSCVLLISFQASAHQQDYFSISQKDCVDSLREYQASRIKQSLLLNCIGYHQTTNYTCGPAVTMTLMQYYGRLSLHEMNQQTELRISQEMGATKDGTTQSQVTSWLSNHRFNVVYGTRVDSKMIMANLQKGIPTIIAMNNHWILAKGFVKRGTSEEDEIVFSDSCCGMTKLSPAAIDAIWTETQLTGNHCVANISQYIIATPK